MLKISLKQLKLFEISTPSNKFLFFIVENLQI